MHGDSRSRRAFVGSAAVATLTALAGCSGGGTTPSQESSGGAESADAAASKRDFGGWLGATTNYDGVVEETDASEVEVTVGSQANGGAYGFSPAAVRVSSGTTVVWTWTGKGNAHDVVSTDGSFASERTGKKGHTFSRALEDAGTYKYYCSPHRAMGMKGVVVVE
ncbi:halocyanin domain-containing protein [Halopelagius longus]|uniref:Halocyanin domain-containing protein n=1 Tax=Halopelagius longus TaxID=1236180 RepID=A0A1H1C370_9EURY|nr:halocyanin domain-containing protein [Halopelagius longus]RDI71049.1 halocyanin domain-containing protein [Halopelagius longus]SDQ58687.1 halocyanin domain-containing protein [Halopelagius longus]